MICINIGWNSNVPGKGCYNMNILILLKLVTESGVNLLRFLELALPVVIASKNHSCIPFRTTSNKKAQNLMFRSKRSRNNLIIQTNY